MKATGKIEAVAAEWISRRETGLDAREERELAEWLADDPGHVAAYSRLDRAAAVFERALRRGDAETIVSRLSERAQRRRRRVAAAAGILATAACALFFLPRPRAPAPAGGNRIGPVAADGFEVRTLADGSVVELRSGAQISVQFEPALRRLRLWRGEAHFQVAKNAARPFLVQAGTVEVRAVGTAFDVNLEAQSVGVIVTEGKVSLDRAAAETAGGASSASALTYVPAGSGIVVSTAFPPDKPPPPTPMTAREMETGLRWRAVGLTFAGTDLSQAVAQMNRYNRLQISIGSAAVGKLRVSGVFNSDNPEGFVRIVQASFDLRAETRGDHEIVLETVP